VINCALKWICYALRHFSHHKRFDILCKGELKWFFLSQSSIGVCQVTFLIGQKNNYKILFQLLVSNVATKLKFCNVCLPKYFNVLFELPAYHYRIKVNNSISCLYVDKTKVRPMYVAVKASSKPSKIKALPPRNWKMNQGGRMLWAQENVSVGTVLNERSISDVWRPLRVRGKECLGWNRIRV
jgi:hypothetical protein